WVAVLKVAVALLAVVRTSWGSKAPIVGVVGSRGSPRWSVVIEAMGVALAMAGLPGWGDMVWVGPPLSARALSLALCPVIERGVPERALMATAPLKMLNFWTRLLGPVMKAPSAEEAPKLYRSMPVIPIVSARMGLLSVNFAMTGVLRTMSAPAARLYPAPP